MSSRSDEIKWAEAADLSGAEVPNYVPKIYPVTFRWEIEQIGPNKIVVKVPRGGDLKLVDIPAETIAALKLSEGEVLKALNAAENAVIRAVMVIE